MIPEPRPSPLADFPLALGEHVDERLSKVSGGEVAELRRSARRLFEANLHRLRTAAGGPVLLHGDFKPSNLHWSSSGELLVLDWEFTFAGPPLMDFGQLTRWLPSASFNNAVASAYRSHGGSLVDDWMRWSQFLDLGNLAGLLAAATPDSRRFTDLMGSPVARAQVSRPPGIVSTKDREPATAISLGVCCQFQSRAPLPKRPQSGSRARMSSARKAPPQGLGAKRG